MSGSTSLLDVISSTQDQKEVTANALFNAGSSSTTFGNRAFTTIGLTWGFYGGPIMVDGVLSTIANGTVLLTASSTNYVEATRAGVVSKNTTGFTPGSIPLYTVVTGTTTVSSYIDYRTWANIGTTGKLAKALSDANTTLTAAEASNQILTFSGTLTATRNIVLPLGAQIWHVYNGTNQSLQFIGATGTGITVATTKRAIVASDGTNIVRFGADV